MKIHTLVPGSWRNSFTLSLPRFYSTRVVRIDMAGLWSPDAVSPSSLMTHRHPCLSLLCFLDSLWREESTGPRERRSRRRRRRSVGEEEAEKKADIGEMNVQGVYFDGYLRGTSKGRWIGLDGSGQIGCEGTGCCPGGGRLV